MKYRWLDSDLPVKHKRLGVGTILALPQPGCIGNVLVRFESGDVTVPAGTLRNVNQAPGGAASREEGSDG